MPKRHRSGPPNATDKNPRKRPKTSKSKKTLKNVGLVPKSQDETKMERIENNVSRMIMRQRTDTTSDDASISSTEEQTVTKKSSLILLPKKQQNTEKLAPTPSHDDRDDYSDDSDELANEMGTVFLSDLIDETADEEDDFSDEEDESAGNDNKSTQNLDSDEEDLQLSIDEKRLKETKKLLKKFEDIHQQTIGTDSTDGIEQELKERRDLLIQNKDPKLQAITQGLADGTLKTEQVFLKGHKNSVTCLSLVEQDPHIVYTGGKDCCILRWDLHSQKKMLFSKGCRSVDNGAGGHENQILTMDVSHDGKYLISGGMDNVIKVWDTRSGKLLNDLDGHFAKVTGLSFRKGTYEFYSGSEDQTVRVWDAEEQSFAATLRGHQDPIWDLHSLEDETCITVGADKTLRWWKIDAETQTIFQGHTGSVDCARMVNRNAAITGSQDGSLCFWASAQRKALHRFPDAHGGKWITSVAAVPHSNLLASGSYDGYIRLYNYSTKKGFQMLEPVRQHGYVNCMEFAMRPGASQNRFMVYGVGLDHRLGRWERLKQVKNGLGILRFVEA